MSEIVEAKLVTARNLDHLIRRRTEVILRQNVRHRRLLETSLTGRQKSDIRY